MSKQLTVIVAYADDKQEYLESFSLAEQSTVADALILAKQSPHFPTAATGHCAYAVFGQTVTLTTLLNDQDRVEILRPLKNNPKKVRRMRTQQAR
ncbi:MAG: RnfH family protein [Burkholderiales bacterium]|jgi:putative ubiquitin-RnfH superfamily antitoxin RatB of RatAB toxin-antitoxin module|nr:RnfH family protein [Burkholderiales bacterium]